MTHLSMAELLALREPASSPGTEAGREHLAACAECRAELDRLHQRVARLKALTSLRPARDQWPVVRDRLRAERRRRQQRWIGVGGLALAASIALALVVSDLVRPKGLVASTEISEAMARSHDLEQALNSYNPDNRATDGLTARVAGELEDRIGTIDRQLEMAQMLDPQEGQRELLRLWRERVGLLDALVDVHVTRASDVGL
jgi:hypothetical protein